MSTPIYLQILPETSLPDISELSPFRAVVIVEARVSTIWQENVSDWLVQSGCLYMMAWGINSTSWDDSVDMANIERFNFEGVPEDESVMTTWHDSDPLNDVFWFCKQDAVHPTVKLKNTLLLHISAQNREQELVRLYADANNYE